MVKNNSDAMMMPALVGAGAFIVGLIIGLVVLGWWLWPVQWTDAGLKDLSMSAKVEYVTTVAESFSATGDIATANERLTKLGNPSAALAAALQNTTGDANQKVALLQSQVGPTLQPDGSTTEQPNLLSALLPVCAAVVLLLVVIGGGVFLFMRLSIPRGKPRDAASAAVMETQRTAAPVRVETPDEIRQEAGPEPVTTFKTTYMLGNDLFDESFSIDDQQGDFLGECGVGIGETIGVGDPKKVTAFEVWLFDKNDIRTVTKVVMSEHAFNDEGLKSRLAAKGEPILARSAGVVEMETATLKVAARIVDMQYGSGALPPNSFFQQLTLEISAWKKSDI
jgi:hypothetical protein